ncbi:hypothetical protein R1sor_020420 [Riccia sorocarpa]|uniref:N-acetyltransferase domain-containing protein n=1 Tax=Riccia sorocarpa TaxID=122646 RepID=A0ABD3IF95_9MARC
MATQTGWFLSPMGLGVSEADQLGCCWSKASFKGESLSSFGTSTGSLSFRRTLCPAVSGGTLRTQLAYGANVGNGLAVERSGNRASEKVRVRSLVEEAAAHSSGLQEVDALSSPSQTSDAEVESEFSEDERERVQMLTEREDSSESESSSERDEEFGPDIIIEEASCSPLEMDYEDSKLGKENRNWSIADMKKLDILRHFQYRVDTGNGNLTVQALKAEHMKEVEELLVDSFAELMGGLLTYRPLLTLTVRQYVRERYACLPHAVTLVGLYAPEEVEMDGDDPDAGTSRNWLLASTVELSFSDAGHPDIPPGPSPPRGSPYLCNMAVSSAYRRRGIGKETLKAAEVLAEAQGCKDIYLHCRLVDAAPLNMYKEAGYEIVATDSILSLLSFQRRRHLMKKKLYPRFPSDEEVTDSDTDSSSSQE